MSQPFKNEGQCERHYGKLFWALQPNGEGDYIPPLDICSSPSLDDNNLPLVVMGMMFVRFMAVICHNNALMLGLLYGTSIVGNLFINTQGNVAITLILSITISIEYVAVALGDRYAISVVMSFLLQGFAVGSITSGRICDSTWIALVAVGLFIYIIFIVGSLVYTAQSAKDRAGDRYARAAYLMAHLCTFYSFLSISVRETNILVTFLKALLSNAYQPCVSENSFPPFTLYVIWEAMLEYSFVTIAMVKTPEAYAAASLLAMMIYLMLSIGFILSLIVLFVKVAEKNPSFAETIVNHISFTIASPIYIVVQTVFTNMDRVFFTLPHLILDVYFLLSIGKFLTKLNPSVSSNISSVAVTLLIIAVSPAVLTFTFCKAYDDICDYFIKKICGSEAAREKMSEASGHLKEALFKAKKEAAELKKKFDKAVKESQADPSTTETVPNPPKPSKNAKKKAERAAKEAEVTNKSVGGAGGGDKQPDKKQVQIQENAVSEPAKTKGFPHMQISKTHAISLEHTVPKNLPPKFEKVGHFKTAGAPESILVFEHPNDTSTKFAEFKEDTSTSYLTKKVDGKSEKVVLEDVKSTGASISYTANTIPGNSGMFLRQGKNSVGLHHGKADGRGIAYCFDTETVEILRNIAKGDMTKVQSV